MSPRLLLILPILTGLSACASPSGPQVESSITGTMPRIQSAAAAETSGIAASTRKDSLFWVINDSGHPAELHAVRADGTSAGTFALNGVKNRDWEDIASFTQNGHHYLAIADVGDNNSSHQTCQIVVVKEPVPTPATRAVPLAWTIRFRYEDGPRDCEAIAIDGDQILLVSKRTTPPALYALPITATKGDAVATARRVVDLTTMPSPAHGQKHQGISAFVTQPTAMDLSPDGRTLAILTYQHIYLIERKPAESWASAAARTPRWIKLPHPITLRLKQREALCFTNNGKSLIVTSEGKHPELYRLDL